MELRSGALISHGDLRCRYITEMGVIASTLLCVFLAVRVEKWLRGFKASVVLSQSAMHPRQMSPRHFIDLVVWKKTTTIAERIRRAAQHLTADDDPWLMHEMRRAALGASSAIAQGYGRSPKAFRKSLAIARGKIARAITLCEVGERVEHASLDMLGPIRAEMAELYQMLTRLRARSLELDG